MRTLRSAQPNQIFAVSVAKRIIKQILLSVDYLHRECGYVHTGNLLRPCPFSLTKKSCLDIRADNVLAALPDSIVLQLDKYLDGNQLATHDNLKPTSQILKSQPLTDFNLDLRHLKVRLIDYGTGETQ